MEREWMEEILERLARKYGTDPETIKADMETYLAGIWEGEGEGDEIDRRILAHMEGGPELCEFISRLAQEREWERKKEEELRSYLDGE